VAILSQKSGIASDGNFAAIWDIAIDLAYFAIAAGLLCIVTALFGIAAAIRHNISWLKFVNILHFKIVLCSKSFNFSFTKNCPVSVHFDNDDDFERCSGHSFPHLLGQSDESSNHHTGHHVRYLVPE
jgi:hypothetical protein